MQRTIGNQAVMRLLQRKLTIGPPGDAYEREADRVAELATHAPTGCAACGGSSSPCESCGSARSAAGAAVSTPASDRFVQPKALGSVTPRPTPSLPIVDAAGSGSPLSSSVRERVEPLLGVNLSDVRVHTDAAAQTSAEGLEAKAFTHRNHIWLGARSSPDDVELMAHELTHVAQQTGRDAPPEALRRQPEDAASAADGDAVRQRLQQRIDEALGQRAPEQETAAAGAAQSREAATPTPAPAAEDPQARQATRQVDRGAVRERAQELEPEARPDVDAAAEQRPRVEEAARSTAETLDQTQGQPGAGASAPQPAQPEGAAAGGEQSGAGGGAAAAAGQQAAAAGQQAAAAATGAAGAAGEAFSAADSQPTPDAPEVIVPPEEIAPVDAGGMPLPGDPESDARAIELANDAQELREQAHSLRENSAVEATNAQILRGNVGLVNQGIAGSEGGVQTAQDHTTFRRGLLEQARQAAAVSERKAADVAARAPGGVEQTNENKSRSGPMASEARDLSARNAANTPDDPEAAERAREQGGQLNRAGSDAVTIDDTLTQVQGAANTLVQDAARAAQLNGQSAATATAVEATLGRTEARISQMQGQNAEARSQLDALRDRPADVSAQAGELGAQGQDLVESSRDIEARLHATQRGYAEGMASVPAVAPPREAEAAADVAPQSPAVPEAAVDEAAPAEAVPAAESAEVPAPVEASAAEGAAAGDSSADVLVQRTPEDGAAAQPSNINIASGLPSWLTGEETPNAAERERQQREQEKRRQDDLDEIERELHGRRFAQLSAGERRRIALRMTARNLFGGLGNISWPTPGGLARGAAHLAAGLIDPRAPMMGVVSGLNMIINGSVNFARQPSWGGALRLAANVATGLTIILGSITALAGVIAALMTAITIVTLGVAAPITGPVIAFCASVMSVVGGWTFWVGLIAAGLQALTFLVDLYMAGTAQTAEQLQQQSERMREDAGNAGNALLQAGMGRLAQVGGRAMQSEIRALGGGVRFASRMGVRAAAAPGRMLGALRSGGGRGLLRGAVSGARALGSGIAGGARAFGRGIRALGRGARALPGRILEGAVALPGRLVRLPGSLLRGARALPGRIVKQLRTEFGRDFLVGEGVGPGFRGLRAASAEARAAARLELAAEAEAAGGAAAAEAAQAERGPARIDDAPPESPAAREASVRESGHIESDRLTDRQLRNEADNIAAHPEMVEGTPPHRTTRVGEHQWHEEPQGWCRFSNVPRCFDHTGAPVQPTRLPEAQRPLDIESYLPEGTTAAGPQRSIRIRPGGPGDVGWREEVRQLGLGNQDVLYVIRDANTGEALKVGLSENVSSRFGAYQTATLEKYSGREIIIDVQPVSVQRTASGARGLDVPETHVRQQLEAEIMAARGGHLERLPDGREVFVDAQGNIILPWDNTGSRLGYLGRGTPGASLDPARGWGWKDVSDLPPGVPRREELVPLGSDAQIAPRIPSAPVGNPRPPEVEIRSWVREYQLDNPTGRTRKGLDAFIADRYRETYGIGVSPSFGSKLLNEIRFNTFSEL